MYNPPIRPVALLILFVLIILTSCSDDGNSAMENPPTREKIDSIRIELTAPGKDPVYLSFTDIDGDGTFESQNPFSSLSSHTAYTASFSFIGKDGVSAQIEQRKEDHIVCYEATDGIVIDYLDTDSNDLPVGLTARWFTSTPGAVIDLVINLNHQHNVKDGQCTDDGLTDFHLTQRIRIMDDVTGEEPEAINTFLMEIWPEPIHGLDPVGVDFADNNGDGILDGLFQAELKAGQAFSFTLYAFAHQEGENFQPVNIEEKMEDHIICFEVTNDILINPTPYELDKDSNGIRTGLSTEWTTFGTAGKTGTLKMTLRHQPEVKTGECPGEGVVDFEAVLKIKLF